MARNHAMDHDAVSGGRGNPASFAEDEYAPRLHFGWGKHLPMIRQSEAAECGPACLAMIAGYYGHHVDLPTLRRHFPLSLKGITLARLIEMAQSLGLACRPLRLEINELSRLQTPCISWCSARCANAVWSSMTPPWANVACIWMSWGRIGPALQSS